MTRIKLVVSDVDGTLLTKDKILTAASKAAVRQVARGRHRFHHRLEPSDHRHGLSDRTAGDHAASRFLQRQLDRRSPLKPIEQHLIPPRRRSAHRRAHEFGVDIWLFTNEQWLTRNPDGEYVGHEKRAIKHDPIIVDDFSPHLISACKIVGASSDPALLMRCEAAMQAAVGAQATAVRSQTYYLDVTPPGHDKGTFVAGMAKRLGIPASEVATIGDMQNDLPMFATSGMSFAMGNAADDIKQRATHGPTSNER